MKSGNASRLARSQSATGADGWEQRAIVYHRKGCYERSAAALRQAIRLKPTAFRWMRLAQLNAALRRYSRANVIAKQLEQRNPSTRLSLFRASVLIKKNRYAQAQRILGEMLGRDPGNENALELLRLLRSLRA